MDDKAPHNDRIGTLQDIRFLNCVPEQYVECVLIQQQRNKSKGTVFNMRIDRDNPVCFTMARQRELIIHPSEKSDEWRMLAHSGNEGFSLNCNQFELWFN